MKKLLFTLLACIIAVSSAFAGSDLKVTSGNKKFFKTASGSAVIEIVYDGATFDDKQPLSEKFTNLNELKAKAIEGFTEKFNEDCKKVKVIGDASKANYKFTMKVSKMDQYFKVMGFVPGNATKVWGTFTITDVATGEVLLEADVPGVNGGANPSPDGSFKDCFEALGENVAQLK